MPGSLSNKLSRATDSDTGRPVIATLASPGKALGAASVTISDATNWSTASKLYFSIFNLTTQGYKDPTTQTDWVGTLSGTTISNLTLTGGTDRAYLPGATIEQTVTAKQLKDTYDMLVTQHNLDSGAHSNITTTAITNNGNYNQSSGTFDVPNETIKLAALGKASDWAWSDYSATSTIVGWGSFTKKVIKYIQIGKTIQVFFTIDGVSNAATASFTLPVPAKNQGGAGVAVEGHCGLIQDNGATPTLPVDWRFYVDPASNASLVAFQKGFVTSGTKSVRGSFFYEVS